MRTSKFGEVTSKHPVKCSSCPQMIVWVKTRSGSSMPVDVGTDVSHFSTCPNADAHRKKRQEAGPPGDGPVLTGHVLRFCEIEAGAVVIARDEEEAILREVKGHVVLVVLDSPHVQLRAGQPVKLRRIAK